MHSSAIKHNWSIQAPAILHAYYDQQKRRRLNGGLPQTRESDVDDGLNVWEDCQWVGQMLSTLLQTQLSPT